MYVYVYFCSNFSNLNKLIIVSYSLKSDQEEITFIVFQSLRDDDEDDGEGSERRRAELDIAVHVKYDQGQTEVAIHSPYWMLNKTGRLLQYKADDIHRKHPLDYDMPLLFSFKPRYFLKNNKVRQFLISGITIKLVEPDQYISCQILLADIGFWETYLYRYICVR